MRSKCLKIVIFEESKCAVGVSLLGKAPSNHCRQKKYVGSKLEATSAQATKLAPSNHCPSNRCRQKKYVGRKLATTRKRTSYKTLSWAYVRSNGNRKVFRKDLAWNSGAPGKTRTRAFAFIYINKIK